jgi:dienelactone hydrolase
MSTWPAYTRRSRSGASGGVHGQPERQERGVDLVQVEQQRRAADDVADPRAEAELQSQLSGLGLGLFGASTGAAATLIAAADMPERVQAVVSRGGRPDLAGPALDEVLAPTLLIVGGADDVVIGLNREAAAGLANAHLVLVPGAWHLFTGPGALQQVTELAERWFDTHLRPAQLTGR